MLHVIFHESDLRYGVTARRDTARDLSEGDTV